MKMIDSSRTYGLSFDIPEKEDAANVIWIDEVKLLFDEAKAEF